MAEPPRWAVQAVLIVALVMLVLLFAQYLLGMWTNLNTTAVFTSNSTSNSLDWHYNVGFILGLVGIVTIVLAGLSRQVRLIGQSVALFVWILLAGIMGSAFVSTQPNPPNDSFLMALFFLLAFGTAIGLLYSAIRARALPRPAPTPVPPVAA
jgi:hypothetical protein